jgi:hypothetical protein
MDIRRQTLNTAADLITKDRPYTDEAARIGRLWGAILRREDIPPRTVATMMIALKLARATAGTPNMDDWTDIAGYSALAAQIDHDQATP